MTNPSQIRRRHPRRLGTLVSLRARPWLYKAYYTDGSVGESMPTPGSVRLPGAIDRGRRFVSRVVADYPDISSKTPAGNCRRENRYRPCRMQSLFLAGGARSDIWRVRGLLILGCLSLAMSPFYVAIAHGAHLLDQVQSATSNDTSSALAHYIRWCDCDDNLANFSTPQRSILPACSTLPSQRWKPA